MLDQFAMVTLLIDTKDNFFVFGGRSSETAISDHVYAFAENKWINRTSMSTAIYGHTAVNLEIDDTVLVCGGSVNAEGEAQAKCDVYDAIRDKWTVAASMKTARYAHGMAIYKGAFSLCTPHCWKIHQNPILLSKSAIISSSKKVEMWLNEVYEATLRQCICVRRP